MLDAWFFTEPLPAPLELVAQYLPTFNIQHTSKRKTEPLAPVLSALPRPPPFATMSASDSLAYSFFIDPIAQAGANIWPMPRTHTI